MVRTFKGRKVYDTDFKFAIIQEYLGSDLSLSVFCKKKSLDCGTFRYWLHIFGPESDLNSTCMSKSEETKSMSESEAIHELKRQLKQKEVELKQEKMRADFYETMVDVAEEQFNICIRKKVGTKR